MSSLTQKSTVIAKKGDNLPFIGKWKLENHASLEELAFENSIRIAALKEATIWGF